MNIALWIVAELLGAAFVVGGILKMTMPRDRFAAVNASSAWAKDFEPRTFKGIGVIETLGGVGMALPAVIHVLPVLVPIAASGMALYMSGAATTRLRRGEWGYLLGDILFVGLCVFVAWGRFGPEPLG
jgi:hypothetical protein